MYPTCRVLATSNNLQYKFKFVQPLIATIQQSSLIKIGSILTNNKLLYLGFLDSSYVEYKIKTKKVSLSDNINCTYASSIIQMRAQIM